MIISTVYAYPEKDQKAERSVCMSFDAYIVSEPISTSMVIWMTFDEAKITLQKLTKAIEEITCAQVAA